ncbi:unnamed protein product [Rotaria magnacalcarata]
MSLWCDKYRPKTFDELDYQLQQAELLQTIVASGDFPHFLIFGPSGSGKKTRITCLLHALYGDGVQSLRIENHEYETPSKKKIEITTIGSNFHIQVNPRRTVAPCPTAPSRTSPPKQRMTQNYLVIWVDGTIDESDEDFQKELAELHIGM